MKKLVLDLKSAPASAAEVEALAAELSTKLKFKTLELRVESSDWLEGTANPCVYQTSAGTATLVKKAKRGRKPKTA